MMLLLLGCVAAAAPVRAETFPAKQVHVIVAYPAGGACRP